MDRNDEQFENYLREFEPRRPRALESKTRAIPKSWSRLAAAAGVMIALGTSLWLVLHSPARQTPQTVKVDTAEPERAPLSVIPLTKLAATDPAQLDAELAAASRRVLPDFRGDRKSVV